MWFNRKISHDSFGDLTYFDKNERLSLSFPASLSASSFSILRINICVSGLENDTEQDKQRKDTKKGL